MLLNCGPSLSNVYKVLGLIGILDRLVSLLQLVQIHSYKLYMYIGSHTTIMFIMQLQARRGGMDEPFAWESREYLRRLLIGQDVRFRVEYTASPSGRKFGMVFFAEKNVACMVVAAGLAKVRTTAFFSLSLSL